MVNFLAVQIKERSSQFSTPLYLPPGQKKRGTTGHTNKKQESKSYLGNLRSSEKKENRYNRWYANGLLLKYSFHDRIRAETVHTRESEKIVAQTLANQYPSVSEVVFQSQVLNHDYGEVLAGPIQ